MRQSFFHWRCGRWGQCAKMAYWTEVQLCSARFCIDDIAVSEIGILLFQPKNGTSLRATKNVDNKACK
jgi:hypothetical protein